MYRLVRPSQLLELDDCFARAVAHLVPLDRLGRFAQTDDFRDLRFQFALHHLARDLRELCGIRANPDDDFTGSGRRHADTVDRNSVGVTISVDAKRAVH